MSGLKQRCYELFEEQRTDDRWGQFVKLFIMGLILVNVIALVAETHFPPGAPIRSDLFYPLEVVSVVLFGIEYLLRVWVCTLNPKYDTGIITGRLRFMASPLAMVDLLSILPFFAPLMIPATSKVDLRFLRTLRLLRVARIFKLGRYSKALQTLLKVLSARKDELYSSLFVMGILLVLSCSLMYMAERDVQPDMFPNITTTFWWGVCTLTTVGYGDVYPVTDMGRMIGSVIAVLGMGMFALPAGIISSGYVEAIAGERGPHDRDVIEKLLNQSEIAEVQDLTLRQLSAILDAICRDIEPSDGLEIERPSSEPSE